MERFEKVLNPLVILFGVIIVLIIKLEQSKQEIMRLKEQQPIIIYQVDNAGAEFGKVTAKDVVDGHCYVEVKPYGKFLVTREQYNEIEIGQEMPEWLKGRGE
ncbi:DUF1372 family protein [Streptococcus suis]|uniref:DUF1372 family protein n=1 Tax=Streptococcus suis TaxID=1307 RepID=UPI0006983CE5|nr:DUF1372 family protein [Streptococcus suis]NQI41933.1 DUF1372 family protein [Streptococcus suis]CYU12964.1 phage protein [Streptococcus suis]